MLETVLDTSSKNVLLRLAGDEGLLVDRPDGDGFLASLRHHPLHEWHKQQVLEQVVLNSKIHALTAPPWDRMEGELVGMGIIHSPKNVPELKEEGRAVSPELIEGMLRSKGYDQGFEKWISIFEDSRIVFNEVMQYQEQHHGIELNINDVIIRGALDREYGRSPEFNLAQRWNIAKQAVSPLLSAVEELLRLDQYANATSIHLRTPIYRLSPNLLNLTTVPTSDNSAVHIYRLTTQKLEVIPFCATLRSAIELSKHPDAVALREKISEWLLSFSANSVGLTDRIQRDIDKASRSLLRAKRCEKVGAICGHLSIPVSLAAALSPFLGALGLSLKCVAVLAEDASHALRTRVRWVGFGSNRAAGR